MRHIGNLNDPAHAERFAAFLVTQNIDATADDENSHWAIWVKDEDQVEAARQHLSEFEAAPDDARYARAVRKAQNLKAEEEERRRDMQKRVVEMRTQWNRGKLQSMPLTMGTIVICSVLALMSNFGEYGNPVRDALMFISHAERGSLQYATPEQKLADVKRGQVWRVLTPAFLHFGVIHLVFNMYWAYSLGGQIEMRKGKLTLAALILVTAVIPNLFQALMPATLGGGMNFAGYSGVVYGLLGYIWVKMYSEPGSGLFVAPPTFFFLVIWMFLGFAGVLEAMFGWHTANWGHGVGLVTGMAFAYLPLSRKPAS